MHAQQLVAHAAAAGGVGMGGMPGLPGPHPGIPTSLPPGFSTPTSVYGGGGLLAAAGIGANFPLPGMPGAPGLPGHFPPGMKLDEQKPGGSGTSANEDRMPVRTLLAYVGIRED